MFIVTDKTKSSRGEVKDVVVMKDGELHLEERDFFFLLP